jgi:N-acetylmuramoyl-L-alanine amidase
MKRRKIDMNRQISLIDISKFVFSVLETMQNYKNTSILPYKKRFYFRTVFLFTIIMLNSITVYSQKKSDGNSIKTVCIDAGHGGKDPGCHGSSANEKTVCLQIALLLGAKIKENYPSINVIYTRDSDVFVELDDRAKIANRNNADLFICIHANSASPAAYGTETFVLGLHRAESQQKIADRENSTIYLEEDKGAKYKDFDMSPDAIIARQLQLSIFLDHSIRFAEILQTEFKEIGRYNRGVKQAGFLVLYKTTMPSVLIETGFLTNPTDELFLKNPESQNKMANAMFESFKKYKNELDGVDEIKSDKKTINDPSIKNSTIIEQANTPKEEKTETSEQNKKSSIIFKVQLETSDKKLSLKSQKYADIKIEEEKEGVIYKYTTGFFENDFESANALKNEMRKKGFNAAFVFAIENGKRIPIDQAINKILKK